MAASIAASTLVAANARLCIAPLPKVASTLLKRVAVLADGREPAMATAFGETRPALAIHRAEVHGLPCLAGLSQEQQEQSSAARSKPGATKSSQEQPGGCQE